MSDTSASPDSVVVSDLPPASASSARAAISTAARKAADPPPLAEPAHQFAEVPTLCREEHQVALRRRRQGDARNRRQPLRQDAGVLVVLRQPLDHVLQRVHTGGGDNARPAHAAAQHLTVPPPPPDELPAVGEAGGP